MAKKATKSDELLIGQITRESITLHLLGNEPLLFNAMSNKVRRELLMPGEKLNKAQRAVTLKHDPIAEFRASIYEDSDPNGETLLVFPSTAFKSALRGAAVDLPGSASKAGIGRQVYVEGTSVAIYGEPLLHMATVRQAGMSRTPDIRTRACVETWCCSITVTYVAPLLNREAISTLAVGAGLLQGIGDFRAEKGAGNYGTFEVVNEDDARWHAITEIGREHQIEAMQNPRPIDTETERLLEYFVAEQDRRGLRSRSA